MPHCLSASARFSRPATPPDGPGEDCIFFPPSPVAICPAIAATNPPPVAASSLPGKGRGPSRRMRFRFSSAFLLRAAVSPTPSAESAERGVAASRARTIQMRHLTAGSRASFGAEGLITTATSGGETVRVSARTDAHGTTIEKKARVWWRNIRRSAAVAASALNSPAVRPRLTLILPSPKVFPTQDPKFAKFRTSGVAERRRTRTS
mmetsp:Transcript_2924/g.6103  ORF Transcript_2924/g.6103 Transcript_2924/m.6103 type:complete len:206 (-) Transcript_2924:57-674(-)